MEDITEIIKQSVDELTNTVISITDAPLQDLSPITPLQDLSPITPLQDLTAPLQDLTAPLQDLTTPLQDLTTPLQDLTAPLQDTTTPLQDLTTPLQDLTTIPIKNPFDFINNPEKMRLLAQVNDMLHINKFPTNKLVFVYSGPKVGSTSIVSSLRIFGTDKLSVIHIHDEEMLKVLGHINGITVNEIILYNKHIGKQVFVIDVYRSPIERKISTYFEKIGAYHFNNTDEKVNTYNIHKVISRFNNLFPHLANGDHFIDKYDINVPDQFDYNKKYLLVQENGITYIKLRLKDTSFWGPILTNIFDSRICIVKDYETANKPIKDLYLLFKSVYRIPRNLLDDTMQCKYLKYFYSTIEQKEYYKQWSRLSTTNFASYTTDQYKIYEELTIENAHIDYIQFNHYRDEGCSCKACDIKRASLANKVMLGIHLTNADQIKHEEAKTQLINKRVNQVNRINNAIRNLPPPPPRRAKNFKQDMSNIVKGRTRF